MNNPNSDYANRFPLSSGVNYEAGVSAWQPTMQLCFISRVNGPASSTTLHQLWRHMSGKEEWRQVPLMSEAEISTPIRGKKPGEA
jgi:hypothetical protein